ncbi:MAG: cation:proton antiporter [Cocleimonas sp.]|nr:cation:proton antiporter [Cocleimonas sp.]
MESFLSSIDYKDPIWISIAFLFGALSRGIGLPPLVGFLMAGFVLNIFGVTGGDFLNEMADLGIALLLFTIGLKLKLKDLLKVEIWGSGLLHMLIFTLVSSAIFLLLTQLNFSLFSELTITSALIISFALSFSSTVFVVKALEERADFLSRYGQIAIGILIIQDLVAVLYIGVSAAKIPSLWAAGLIILLFIARPLIIKLSMKIGHGELLLLFGLSMALGGSALFEAVDMKADLGALVFGVLLANTPKAEELSKALLSVKELFLVGFFLSIGMAGLPDITTFIVVLILLPLLIFKSGLFFWLLSKFKERTFPASKVSLALANYSEFGLIVTIVAVSQGWITNEWLVVMAVLIAVSFVVSSTVNQYSDDLYSRFQYRLKKYQHPLLLEEDSGIDLADIKILVCGMGRVGSGAYDQLKKHNKLIGLDIDPKIVKSQLNNERKTYYANVSGADFWSKIDIKNSDVEWVILCAPNVDANKAAAKLARNWGFEGNISATSLYSDEKEVLIASGVNNVFNIYSEAGAGLALHGQKTSIVKKSKESKG